MKNKKFLYSDNIDLGQWLAEHLDYKNLRIFESTMYSQYDPSGNMPITARNARAEYNAEHILGAGYLDLQNDLSDQHSPFRFTMPQHQALAKTLGQFGIDDGHKVIF